MTLEEARKAKGLTQEEMAKLLGYKSSVAYLYFEKYIYKRWLQKLKLVCDILGIDIKELDIDEEKEGAG